MLVEHTYCVMLKRAPRAAAGVEVIDFIYSDLSGDLTLGTNLGEIHKTTKKHKKKQSKKRKVRCKKGLGLWAMGSGSRVTETRSLKRIHSP